MLRAARLTALAGTLASLVGIASGCSGEAPEGSAAEVTAAATAVREVRTKLCVKRTFVQDEKFDADDEKQKIQKTKFTVDDSNPSANSYWMAVASSLSYADDATIRPELTKHWGARRVEWFSESATAYDTQAFFAEIAHDDKTDTPPVRLEVEGIEVDIPGERGVEDMTIVAFRGTERTNRTDWKTDFNSSLLDLKSAKGDHVGYVHEGFTKALDAIWPKLLPLLKATKRPIFLTGHSLGGALATLTAMRLMLDGDPNVRIGGLYTFGSPRVGEATFATTFNDLRAKKPFPLRRYVNKNDIVAMVPDRVMGALSLRFGQLFLSGWTHVGKGDRPDDQLVWYEKNWQPYTNAEATKRMSTSVWMSDIGSSWVEDHRIEHYVPKVELAAFGTRTLCPDDTGSPFTVNY